MVTFYQQYYSPNNAVLAIAGDVNSADIFAKVEEYFGGIAARTTPAKPNLTETPQKAERRGVEEDKLAKAPGLAVGYRTPPASRAARWTS